jgi:hypothetical protein
MPFKYLKIAYLNAFRNVTMAAVIWIKRALIMILNILMISDTFSYLSSFGNKPIKWDLNLYDLIKCSVWKN